MNTPAKPRTTITTTTATAAEALELSPLLLDGGGVALLLTAAGERVAVVELVRVSGGGK
jgi:hypothetical protein